MHLVCIWISLWSPEAPRIWLHIWDDIYDVMIFFGRFVVFLWHRKTTTFRWNYLLFFKYFWIGWKQSISGYYYMKPNHIYQVFIVFSGLSLDTISIFCGFWTLFFILQTNGGVVRTRVIELQLDTKISMNKGNSSNNRSKNSMKYEQSYSIDIAWLISMMIVIISDLICYSNNWNLVTIIAFELSMKHQTPFDRTYAI